MMLTYCGRIVASPKLLPAKVSPPERTMPVKMSSPVVAPGMVVASSPSERAVGCRWAIWYVPDGRSSNA